MVQGLRFCASNGGGSGLIPSGRTKIPNGAAKVLRIEKEGGHRHWLDLRAFGDNQHKHREKLAPRFHPCHVDEASPFTKAVRIAASDQSQQVKTETHRGTGRATENHNGGMKELPDL